MKIMIRGDSTKKGTGIQIFGDYSDLKQLHQTLYRLCEAPNDSDKNPITNIILNFAYEVRKAYSGQRLKDNLEFHGGHKNDYLGFQYLWTDMVVTLNALRFQAGLVTTTEMDQANIYLLEYITKGSLDQYDVQGAQLIKRYIVGGIDVTNRLLEQITQYINILYLGQKPSKSRFRNIPKLFNYYSPLSTEYKSFDSEIRKQANQFGIPLEEVSYDESNYPEEIIW
ncbi:hypothetical protein AAOE16_07050 [Ekhidna sp. MALMAid0563]